MTHDHDILARTIYGEARGELKTYGIASLIAVGNVVMNRLAHKRFGSTIVDVCLSPWQFSCWNPSDPNVKILNSPTILKDPLFKTCQDVAFHVLNGQWPDVTNGSDHYYATSMTTPPFWARQSKPRVSIGRHLFFKLG